MSKFSSHVVVFLDFTSFTFLGDRVCVSGCMCWKQYLDVGACDVRSSVPGAGEPGCAWPLEERGDRRKHQALSLAQHCWS